MTGRATFVVTDPGAPRRVADRGVGEIADRVCEDVRARTPVETGTLQASWRVDETGRDGERTVTTDVEYARFVEYGTRNMAAEPMLGPVLAESRAP